MWNNIVFTSDKGVFKISNGKVSAISAETKHYYGLTWNDEYIFTCGQSIEMFDKDFNKIEEWNGGADLHQCLWANNKLHICTTREDAVSILDIETGKAHPVEPANCDHLNSIFFKDKKFYCCIHGNCKTTQCLQGLKAYPDAQHSQIVEFDLSFKETNRWRTVGHGNHNVFVQDGFIYTLNSVFGKLMKINMETDIRIDVDLKIDDAPPIFPRGLARNDDYFFIGASHQASREDRSGIVGYIIALDNDLNFIDYFELPDFHHVREVRLVNQVDYAHSKKIWEL